MTCGWLPRRGDKRPRSRLRRSPDESRRRKDRLRERPTTARRGRSEAGGNGAQLSHPAVGLCEDSAGGIAIFGARRLEFLERLPSPLEAGELVLARAQGADPPFVLPARAGQLRLAGGARKPSCLDRL